MSQKPLLDLTSTHGDNVTTILEELHADLRKSGPCPLKNNIFPESVDQGKVHFF